MASPNLNDKERAALKGFYKIVADMLAKKDYIDVQSDNEKELKKERIVRKTFTNIKSLKFGFLYSHVYMPKYKDDPTVLPFYDNFPLYIPFQINKYGNLVVFNLHYLRPNIRIKVIGEYIKFVNAAVVRHYGKKIVRKDGEIMWTRVGNDVVANAGATFFKSALASTVGTRLKYCIRSYIPNHILGKIYQLHLAEIQNFKNLNRVFPPLFMRKSANEIYDIIDESYRNGLSDEYSWDID